MSDLSQFKDVYISEVEDHLQALNDNLLKLEKKLKKTKASLDAGDKKILDELMRSSHTIKGSSATMEYKQMAFLSHIMEDVFDYARNDLLELTPKIIEIIYQGVDRLEDSLKSIKDNNKEKNLNLISKKIVKVSGVNTKGIGKSKRNNEGKPVSQKKEDSLKSVEQDSKVKNNEKEVKHNLASEMKNISYVKVPARRLDDLLEVMEELVVEKMRLEEVFHEVTRLKKDHSFQANSVEELKKSIEHLSKLLSNLQDQVMKSRMIPVDQIFARFPRMVRDLAKKKNKRIDFKIDAGNLELDRIVIDKLAEPLLHLLRNAVDHGINKQGKILLKARREKDRALIIVENTGNNIDLDKIKQAAQKKNILNKKDLDSMDKKQLLNLIFHPRFSTKKKVSETSGRGVGLSVVKDFVKSINGKVVLETNLKKGGTRFIMELPSTMAILKSLLVKSAGKTFALPFSDINRSVRIPKKNIKSMADQDIAIVNNREVPLIRLNKILELKQEAQIDKGIETVILVNYHKEVVGIVVDKLLNKQEIIVKPLPLTVNQVKGFSGSTILGNGSVILILDILSLVQDKNKLVRS